MKMLPKNTGRGKRSKRKVLVTGIDGDKMEFATAAEAAKFMDVSKVTIYFGIREKKPVRGCKIEFTSSPGSI